jgi:hypothetical protein
MATMTRLRTPRLLSLAGLLMGVGPLHADAVVDWNAIAMQTISMSVPPHPGTTGILDLAQVQAAVYDAVEAIDGRYRPYRVAIPGASGSLSSAAAKAAHDVLVRIYPSQATALDRTYSDYLAANGLAPDDPGVAVGERAAAGILALNANDGSFPTNPPDSIRESDSGLGARRLHRPSLPTYLRSRFEMPPRSGPRPSLPRSAVATRATTKRSSRLVAS